MSGAAATDAITFELLASSDIAEVAELEILVSPEPWSLALFEGELDMSEASRDWLVARSGSALVGFGGMMYVEPEAHLMNIAVDPQMQGKGVATELLLRLVRRSISRGMTALTLEVRVDNAAAKGLYQRFGFAPVGMRPKYYQDGEDALIMWANDVDSDDYGTRLTELEATR